MGVVRRVALAIAVGLAVGALTQLAQGWLPDGVGSLANSAGPWALAAFLVALVGRTAVRAAALGLIVLATCELGYAICTELRGGSSSDRTIAFWLGAALIAGPIVGIAASWTRGDRAELVGAGTGVIAGVLCGEAVYGLTTVAATTSTAYWTGELVVGIAVPLAVHYRRRPQRTRLAAALMTIGTAAVVLAAARIV